jgi:hypothetical protein
VTRGPAPQAMHRAELRARRAVAWAATDAGAMWAFRAALVAAVPIFYVVGRTQWFNRDDWAFVLTREQMQAVGGWSWLLAPQDGHWLTVPILFFQAVGGVFGIDSYWPFLLLALLSHAAAVVLVRMLCRRVGVSAWTTTLLAVMLLLFGAGWHNLTFAIQVCYNLSVVCFVAQILLADHDGPVDRRDVAGAAVGLLGVMTSGFGPIFMIGVAVLLVLRRRWLALAVSVGPQAVAYLWWTLWWNQDVPAAVPPGDRSQVPAYVVRGVSATFEALVAFPALAGVAVLATLTLLFGGAPWAARRVTLALAATVVVMFAGIGWQRIGLGLHTAGASRYVDVAALVLAPAVGLSVDSARRLAPELLAAARIVLIAALVLNLGTLRSAGATFGRASRYERRVFSLVAGSEQAKSLDPNFVPVPNSPDVNLWELPQLVDEGAITPAQPADAAEQALLDETLRTGAPMPPMPGP